MKIQLSTIFILIWRKIRSSRILFILLFQLVSIYTYSQDVEITFEVFLQDKRIGQLHAKETKTGTMVIRDVKPESTAHILAFSIHVETDTKVTSENQIMVEGVAYCHANHGAKEIHAITKRLSSKKYQRDHNGVKPLCKQEIQFCVADLFFEEPLGLQKIYWNMFAEMVVLKDLGYHKCQVTSPEKKTTVYAYSNGKLVTVESETPAGTVLSKRK